MGPIATAVNVHFAAATHNFKVLEYTTPVETDWMKWVEDPYLPKEGYLELRDTPGLGIEVNEDAAKESAYIHWQRTAPVRPDGSTGYI
jgi:galactonate dehydratase